MFNLFDSIQRLNKFPLESTSVQETIESAKEYVENQYSTAYEGQILYIKGVGFYGIFKNAEEGLTLHPLLNEDSVREIAKSVAHDEMQHVFDDGGDHTGDASDTKTFIDTKIDTHIQDMILTKIEGSSDDNPQYALDGGEI